MKLMIALRSEMLKIKRTAALYLSVLIAAPIPAIFLLNVLTAGGDLDAIRQDPLSAMFEMGAERNGLVFFPIFVILVCTLLPQIEYRNNTWKQAFTAPQTKRNIFLSKFLNINLLILVFLFANLVFMTLAIVVTHFFYPELHLFDQPFDVGRMLMRTVNSYITILAMCTIQFWLGLRFRNFIIPIAFGLALWFTGMIMALEFKSEWIDVFPYSLQIFPHMPVAQSKLTQVAWTSIGYAALFFILGYLDFRKRKITA